MRMLGKLAIAAGATAVVLLAAPAANADTDLKDLKQLSKSVSHHDNSAKATPRLPAVGGLQLPIISELLGGLLGGVGGGINGG